MNVIVSPKFQILIPKEIRKAVGIKKGEKFQMFVRGKTIILVPDSPIKQLRGFLKGMNTEGLRENEDRV